MPKLSRQVIEERKTVIEDATRELLIKQGFHATSMRDIARRAKISLGNVYNYFETKEAIFESIINRYLLRKAGLSITSTQAGDFSVKTVTLAPVSQFAVFTSRKVCSRFCA